MLLLSIVTFYISVNSPIDPIETKYTSATTDENVVLVDQLEVLRQKQRLGLLLPTFYFRLAPLDFNGKYYDLKLAELRELYERAIYKGYDGDLILEYLLEFEDWYLKPINWENEVVNELILKHSFFSNLDEHLIFWISLDNRVGVQQKLNEKLNNALKEGISLKRLVPKVLFFKNNQYHHWLFGGKYTKGVVNGDLGKSYSNGKSVFSRIKKALPWTFLMSLITIFLSVFGSVLLGLILGYFNNKWWSKGIKSFLFLLYTMPAFWLATLLLLFFANPDFLSWFPPGGIKPLHTEIDPSFWQLFWQSFSYLVLPIVALSYSSITVLSRYLQSSTAEAMQSLYVFSVRTRGVSEKRLLLKHVMPNVLLPLITLIGAAIPGLFSGSIVIESIFSIPGMGQELFTATLNNDINLVVGILTISGALSILGYLISDALYVVVDPRIKLENL
ncbi:MAG: ABC transporter permease [Bacteroidia bacterium]